MATVAYALSPIDLIPDVIPVLGYLDDLILVPVGVWLAVRLTGPVLMAEFRSRAAQLTARPVSRAGAVAVVATWAAALGLGAWIVLG